MPPAQYAAENGIDAICVVYSIPNFITDRNLVFLASERRKERPEFRPLSFFDPNSRANARPQR